jgi:hypothetical protein
MSELVRTVVYPPATISLPAKVDAINDEGNFSEY